MNFNLAVILQETALAFPDRPAAVYAGGQHVLHAHPAVAEAAVIGIPHERLGEEVMAVVTVRDGAAVTEAELRAYCRERVAAYKYPRRFEFRAQLPKNSLGKVLKDELLPPRPLTSTAASGRPRAAAGKGRPWNA